MLTKEEINNIYFRFGGNLMVHHQAILAVDLQAENDRLKETISSLTVAFDELNATIEGLKDGD